MENKTVEHRTEYELLQRIKVRAYMEDDEVMARWIREYASQQCAELQKERDELQYHFNSIDAELEEAEADNERLQSENESLKKRVSELEGGLNDPTTI